MQNTSILNSNFKIKRFQASEDKDFIKALKIYNDTIPVETKTDTNEIVSFVDKNKSGSREMFFFGLYYNNEIIGYIESAYLQETKVIMIDYITLKTEFNLNGIFYPLFSLFQQFFSENLIDYDYIITEISVRTIDESVDKESYFSRKLLRIEDFKIIDIPYPQPQLGANNFESNFDLRLMIKSLNPIKSLKTDTLLSIVKDIYFNHYYDWYKNFMTEDETKSYSRHLEEQQEEFRKNLRGLKIIKLAELPHGLCDHFLSKDCYYNSNEISTAGFVSNSKLKHKNWLLLLGIPITIIVGIVISYFIYMLLDKYKIASKDITPIFASISATITGIIALLFSNKAKK